MIHDADGLQFTDVTYGREVHEIRMIGGPFDGRRHRHRGGFCVESRWGDEVVRYRYEELVDHELVLVYVPS